MSYRHSHNILYCDLKTEKIYFDELFYPKIAGFDISKEIKEGQVKPNKTIKGTLSYIAP